MSLCLTHVTKWYPCGTMQDSVFFFTVPWNSENKYLLEYWPHRSILTMKASFLDSTSYIPDNNRLWILLTIRQWAECHHIPTNNNTTLKQPSFVKNHGLETKIDQWYTKQTATNAVWNWCESFKYCIAHCMSDSAKTPCDITESHGREKVCFSMMI